MAYYSLQKQPKNLFIVQHIDGRLLRNHNRDTPLWFRKSDAERALINSPWGDKELTVKRIQFQLEEV